MRIQARWVVPAAALALSALVGTRRDAPAPTRPSEPEPEVREAAPVLSRPAVPPRAALTPSVPLERIAPADDFEAAPLDVDFEGRRLVWTKEDIARVARAGGTHDLRELAAALLGVTDVRVTISGQTPNGSGSAHVDLGALGAEDELRVWPEGDGSWSVARNVSRDDGRATYEQYRLEEVLGLQFARR